MRVKWHDLSNILIYLLAAVLFFLGWIEASAMFGFWGNVLGWFPGLFAAIVWLAITGRLKMFASPET